MGNSNNNNNDNTGVNIARMTSFLSFCKSSKYLEKFSFCDKATGYENSNDPKYDNIVAYGNSHIIHHGEIFDIELMAYKESDNKKFRIECIIVNRDKFICKELFKNSYGTPYMFANEIMDIRMITAYIFHQDSSGVCHLPNMSKFDDDIYCFIKNSSYDYNFYDLVITGAKNEYKHKHNINDMTSLIEIDNLSKYPLRFNMYFRKKILYTLFVHNDKIYDVYMYFKETETKNIFDIKSCIITNILEHTCMMMCETLHMLIGRFMGNIPDIESVFLFGLDKNMKCHKINVEEFDDNLSSFINR